MSPAGQPLSYVTSKSLEYKSQMVVPNMFEDLIGESRVELLEIACEPDSILSKTFQDKTGRSDAACRSSLRCGHDLATREGLLLVLEQVRSLRPKRLWISPPCGAYSPLQNINQRTPAQIQALKSKRATANLIYASTLEIAKTCLQIGIHVTVELSERCEAWRLPVFQKLRFEMGLFTAVTKGCSVGLKGQDGHLTQKGWRIVTTHERLAEALHKTCKCPTNYKHAKCEAKNATTSAGCTKEYARLVYDAYSREGSFHKVIKECSGESNLPEGFGLGLLCTCQEANQMCGACMLQSSENSCMAHESGNPQSSAQGLEAKAKQLSRDPRNLSLDTLYELLKQCPPKQNGKSRRSVESSVGSYQVFGSYAYGNQYGVTNRTHAHPELCQYINKILQRLLPKDMKWTSFALNHGSRMPIHRDHNNDAKHPNGSVGFGSCSGGGLWIEGDGSLCGRKGLLSTRENHRGELLEGAEYNIMGKPVVFHPDFWHGSCDWEGDRWVLTVFVSRRGFSVRSLMCLRPLGFPLLSPASLKPTLLNMA